MHIFIKSVVCSIILVQATHLSCGEGNTADKPLLRESTKAVILLSAPFIAAWNTTRVRQSLNEDNLLVSRGHYERPYDIRSKQYGMALKSLFEDRCFKPNHPLYDKSFSDLYGKLIFKSELNKSVKNWYLLTAGVCVTKRLYDLFEEYRKK
jgi:hypothetical protein